MSRKKAALVKVHSNHPVATEVNLASQVLHRHPNSIMDIKKVNQIAFRFFYLSFFKMYFWLRGHRCMYCLFPTLYCLNCYVSILLEVTQRRMTNDESDTLKRFRKS